MPYNQYYTNYQNLYNKKYTDNSQTPNDRYIKTVADSTITDFDYLFKPKSGAKLEDQLRRSYFEFIEYMKSCGAHKIDLSTTNLDNLDEAVRQDLAEAVEEIYAVEDTVINRLWFYLESTALTRLHFIEIVPLQELQIETKEQKTYLVFCFGGTKDIIPTTRESTLLPQLIYLTCLTPTDFFLFFEILASVSLAKPTTITASGRFKIDFAQLGITPQEFNNSQLSRLFKQFTSLYGLNQNYLRARWFPFTAVQRIAELPPTAENQLKALQYITNNVSSTKIKNVPPLPIETIVDLELNTEHRVEQIDADYASIS